MNVFIGCSSKNTIEEKYFHECKKILKLIAQNNDLVFGVSSSGLMGICYQEFKNNNRKIIGITTDTFKEEFNYIPCDEEYIVYSTLDRTKEIINQSNIFLFLPGGLGTYAEIFQIYEEIRTYKINKKIIIYNYNNYYKKLKEILKKITKEKFMDKDLLNYIEIIDNEKDLLIEFKDD